MSNDGVPCFEDRLAALAGRLVVAIDVSTVLTIRSEVMGIAAALAASKPRAQRAMRERARGLRQARELRGRCEVIAGELLISMGERGQRRARGGGDQKTLSGRSRVSLASLGLKSWATASRWMVRAREAQSTSPRQQPPQPHDKPDDGEDRVSH
jgi:hypothetical protein